MATTHAPGTGVGPGDADGHGRRAAVIAGVVLVCAAIVIPFGLHGVERSGAEAAPTGPVSTSSVAPATHHEGPADRSLGVQGDLPSLLPARSAGLHDGVRVRVGDITEGTVRRTPTQGWQVVVRWNGRLQALTTRGSVGLRDLTWVSRSGLLYTRIPTDTAGRFRVYAWDPQGGTAYTPPVLVATSLGRVCFNHSFTAFGGCAAG
jgi:hypothetical protein